MKYGESKKEIYALATDNGKAVNETLYITDIAGNIVAKETSGSVDEVIIGADLVHLLETSPAGSLISTHNHPDSSAFSWYDMNMAVQFTAIGETRVFGHDGTEYLLVIGTGERPSATMIRRAYDHLYDSPELGDQMWKGVVEGKYSQETAWKEHSHIINEMLAENFGWNYERVLP
jgi:hypothetical protein